MRSEQRRHKGERNAVCVCVYMPACAHCGAMAVRVLCFTVFCHDALLYYSAQRALHMRNGFSLISTAA